MRSDFYVYCWTNSVNGKCYVGKGRGRRALDHLKPGRQSAISKAIAKYGRDSIPQTPEAVQKRSEALRSYKRTPEHAAAIAAGRKRMFEQKRLAAQRAEEYSDQDTQPKAIP